MQIFVVRIIIIIIRVVLRARPFDVLGVLYTDIIRDYFERCETSNKCREI